MPDRASAASNASCDGKRGAHALHFAVDRVSGRLRRRIAIDLGQHQLAVDQLRQHRTDRIGRAVRGLQTQIDRRRHVGQRDQLSRDDRQHAIDHLRATRRRNRQDAREHNADNAQTRRERRSDFLCDLRVLRG